MGSPVVQFLLLFFKALWLVIIIYVLGSWVPSLQRQGWFRTVRQIVEPMLEPFRRILPPQAVGGLDLSPFFLCIVLGFVQNLLVQLLG